jgi:hypothetical protein
VKSVETGLRMLDEEILKRFNYLIAEGEQLLQQINADDASMRDRARNIMFVGGEFHEQGPAIEAFRTKFRNFITQLGGSQVASETMSEIDNLNYASNQIEKMIGRLQGLQSDYESGLIEFLNSSNSKTGVLLEFERVIHQLRQLADEIPTPKTYRPARGEVARAIEQELADTFYSLRTRCLQLLTKIASEDMMLKQTIDFIREVEVSKYNTDSILRMMQSLKSDYEAGILTHHPRLPEVSKETVVKQSWLNEPRAMIIAALIGAVAVIGAAFIGIGIGRSTQANVTDSNIVQTQTFDILPTHFDLVTPSPTSEITPEP